MITLAKNNDWTPTAAENKGRARYLFSVAKTITRDAGRWGSPRDPKVRRKAATAFLGDALRVLGGGAE